MGNVLVELRPAWRNYWFGFLLAAVFLFLSLGSVLTGQGRNIFNISPWFWLIASVLVLGFVIFKRFSWKFTVNDSRVSRHYGLVSRNQQSVRIRDLRSIELDQSLFQRLFGTGNLAFYSAGSAAAEVTFVGIKDPGVWRDKIDDAMDRLKDSEE
ncbi:PH domain-containing protein [Marinimicrobium sp. ABcell2]|uniref:PH domain-containing protein n=1 Tax=Marinimicrobium sp. ABcell2 TaxID=3069751 RepID=UPI0027B3632C|nr:PH domain-containing protein [Marinimicrobium sp. ABcell2]MDQ2078050.1 PH domain-containing protein [Marinimicrobium sp. ABcell2]